MEKLPRLKELRLKLKLTQAQMAEQLNMHQQQYSRYESGKFEPPLKHIKNICKTFNVTTDWLLGMDLEEGE